MEHPESYPAFKLAALLGCDIETAKKIKAVAAEGGDWRALLNTTTDDTGGDN